MFSGGHNMFPFPILKYPSKRCKVNDQRSLILGALTSALLDLIPQCESDPFLDIEFNDDIFAALDAAVQQRQTQSVTQNQCNTISSTNASDNSQSSQGKALQRKNKKF